MSISRRVFVKLASVTAIAAATIAKPTLIAWAQGGVTSTDPLANYTQETFIHYINSIFQFHGFRTVEVTLERVEDTLPAKTSRAGGRESFVLHFRGGSAELPQNTYTVQHPALGTFLLFLVPKGADENGAQGYAATINRLAHAQKPAGPRKPLRKTLQNPSPETGSPGPPPSEPDTNSSEPAQRVTPPTAPKVQPRRRKTEPDGLLGLDIQ